MPYASIGFRFGDGAQNMLLLVGQSTDPLLWTARAKYAIVTDHGHVMKTTGFKYNLGGYQLQSTLENADASITKRWLADFPDMGRYSVAIVCTTRKAGPETVTILDQNIQTVKVEETCASGTDDFSWSFRNTYWSDETTGIVWRSKQYVHPKLDAIEIETFRPVARH